MANFTNTPPDWKATGIEPTEELKTTGFTVGYKPPAAFFNWFWTKVSKCLEEIQKKVAGEKVDPNGNLKGEIFNGYSAPHKNQANGYLSHAEGGSTQANGDYSHAEGYSTKALGDYSYSRGSNTTANADYSSAVGLRTTADGICGYAAGIDTIANSYQAVFGKNNTAYAGATSEADTTGTAFIIGVGTADNSRANAFRVTNAGQCMGTAYFASSGADYSEYFEWIDGNPDNEDRRGLFVTLDGEKIRVANSDDDYILGIVSATPMVIGDIQSEEWHDRFLKDIFGERLTETVEVPETTDEETGKVVPAHKETRFILNPEYDSKKEYKGRNERKEWTTVGLLGKIIVIDDGSCEINGYCKVADNGTATKSTEKTEYRVLSRIDNNHIKILLK